MCTNHEACGIHTVASSCVSNYWCMHFINFLWVIRIVFGTKDSKMWFQFKHFPFIFNHIHIVLFIYSNFKISRAFLSFVYFCITKKPRSIVMCAAPCTLNWILKWIFAVKSIIVWTRQIKKNNNKSVRYNAVLERIGTNLILKPE